MFVFLDGKYQLRILVNTAKIESVIKTKSDNKFFIQIGMDSGEKIKLNYISDEDERDKDFVQFTDALCYHPTTMENKLVMNYHNFAGRTDTHTYVRGENYQAVEITNTYDKDKNRLSFHITNK